MTVQVFSALQLCHTDFSSISVDLMISHHSLAEAERSLFQVLMLNCDIWLLDPETQAFEETTSAVNE